MFEGNLTNLILDKADFADVAESYYEKYNAI